MSATVSITSPPPSHITPWTYPDSCSTVWHRAANPTEIWSNGDTPGYSSCLPPEKANDKVILSPGVCPSGFTINRSSTEVLVSQATRTAAVCCRSGFSFTQTFSTETWCFTAFSNTQWTVFDLATSPTATPINKAVVTSGFAYHYGWEIIWEDKDVSLFDPQYQVSLVGSKTTNSPTTNLPSQSITNVQSPTESPKLTTSHKPLSLGAKIAIGLLPGLIVCSIVVGLFFWYIQKRKGRAQIPEPDPDLPAHFGRSELPAGKVPVEADSREVARKDVDVHSTTVETTTA